MTNITSTPLQFILGLIHAKVIECVETLSIQPDSIFTINLPSSTQNELQTHYPNATMKHFETTDLSYSCLPVINEYADLMLVNLSISYAIDIETFMHDIKRVLNENGLVVIMTLDEKSKDTLLAYDKNISPDTIISNTEVDNYLTNTDDFYFKRHTVNLYHVDTTQIDCDIYFITHHDSPSLKAKTRIDDIKLVSTEESISILPEEEVQDQHKENATETSIENEETEESEAQESSEKLESPELFEESVEIELDENSDETELHESREEYDSAENTEDLKEADTNEAAENQESADDIEIFEDSEEPEDLALSEKSETHEEIESLEKSEDMETQESLEEPKEFESLEKSEDTESQESHNEPESTDEVDTSEPAEEATQSLDEEAFSIEKSIEHELTTNASDSPQQAHLETTPLHTQQATYLTKAFEQHKAILNKHIAQLTQHLNSSTTILEKLQNNSNPSHSDMISKLKEVHVQHQDGLFTLTMINNTHKQFHNQFITAHEEALKNNDHELAEHYQHLIDQHKQLNKLLETHLMTHRDAISQELQFLPGSP